VGKSGVARLAVMTSSPGARIHLKCEANPARAL
jgi:hypothetical protein